MGGGLKGDLLKIGLNWGEKANGPRSVRQDPDGREAAKGGIAIDGAF